jgi:hypothetical protein
MANGLLNQLLLQQSEQTAPMQRRFNLQNFLTGATQMSNQIARQEERQRQNSLRNLIAAREQEGIGFDQLSNEAAKYDMNAANTMRDEFRNSYKFNQQQSDAELARFKREMADYWFGEVLRRAGQAGLGPEQLKYITYQAASMIAPYDSDLAYKLLRDSEMAQANDNKLEAAANKPQKPQKDHTDQFNANRKKYSEAAQDFDKNPKQYRENRMMMLVDDAIRAWKYRSPEKGEQYAHLGGYSRAIWTPMETALAEEVKRRFPEYNVSVSQYNAAEKWLRGLKDEDFNNIPGFMETVVENEFNNNEPAQNTITPKNNVGNASAPVDSAPQEGSGGVELPKSLITWDGDTNSKRVDDDAVGELYAAIPYLVTREDFKKAGKLASQLNKMESGEGASYSQLQKEINEQRKKIQSEIDDLKSNGYNVTEDDFEKYKKLFGARAAQGTLRQFMNFNSGVASYYTDSPLTSMINWLLVAEPNYKANDIEFKNARRLKGSTSQKFRTFLANLNIPVVSKWQDLENDYPALFAAAMGSVNIAREMWSSLTSDMDGEDKEKAEKFMQKMFRIGPEAMSIIKGESDLAYDEDAYQEELAKRKKARKKLPIYSVDGKKDTSSTESEGGIVYTKKSWEDFE